ncbi:hypothetical protein L873DRAFT_1828654 [Choiromyces venosus 120613-1]|uniref:Uncharacterized protein n=1 Tax=Choiromyces venosus 120613-1 TaxID=1336337 RepID=A0A3N4JIP7_9PEZI|nr:hypothetical protein L873DRAFT_1828654 [Choiromyces venosus 120613-1]
MLHAVFIQTADVFNTPARQQPRAVIYTNAQVNTSIPSCNERFQYALDQLEMEILTAKAALRRDLTALRMAAQAREEARLAAERARLEEQRRREAEIAARKEAEERAKREKEQREEEERKRRQRQKEREEAEAKEKLMKKQQQEAEEGERARKAAEAAKAAAMARKVIPGQIAGSVGGGAAAGYGFHYADDKKVKENPAPPAPGSSNPSASSAAGTAAPTAPGGGDSFDDLMASVPVGGDMGGGQPLQPFEESDLFGEFNDLFMFPGT